MSCVYFRLLLVFIYRNHSCPCLCLMALQASHYVLVNVNCQSKLKHLLLECHWYCDLNGISKLCPLNVVYCCFIDIYICQLIFLFVGYLLYVSHQTIVIDGDFHTCYMQVILWFYLYLMCMRMNKYTTQQNLYIHQN